MKVMKAVCPSVLVIFLSVCLLPAQALLNLPPGEGCNYDGSASRQESVYSFAPSDQAREVIDEIMNQMVLPSNFTIKAANVPNAMAQVIQGERYILYDETFMEQIYNQTGDYWAQVSILAHEIGHHLSGHTLGRGGSRPELELQADKFSGSVLFRLGATLEQAQAAVSTLPDNIESTTHPAKSARMTAIAVGYRQAREQAGGVPPQPEKEETPPPPSEEESPVEEVKIGDRTYRTIHFDGLTWMAQNLNYEVPDSWCYRDDDGNCRKYGRLYTYEAAKKACEEVGWRLPADSEWRDLAKRFGGADDDAADGGAAAFKALTDGGSDSNRSGFGAQFGGYRNSQGFFYSLGQGEYWSSTERGSDYAWRYYFNTKKDRLDRNVSDKAWGFSCRCVRE